MSRAIVLVLCLTAAGAVAGYTHYSQDSAEQTPVFTVHAPHRNADPAPPAAAPVQPSPRATVAPGDRASLTRGLQRELKRVGCYSGEINGVWTTSSRMAMKSFTDHVNATLPIDNPDDVLLSLVQGHRDVACSAPCATGQAANENGRCTPNAVLAKGAAETAPLDAKAEPQVDKSSITTGSIVPAAAAATALAASAAIPKAEPKGSLPESRVRPAAVAPDETPPKSGRPERSSRSSGPVPSERVHERRTRRTSSNSRPPKFVRNVLRAFGIR